MRKQEATVVAGAVASGISAQRFVQRRLCGQAWQREWGGDPVPDAGDLFRSRKLMSLETEERHADDLGSSLELVVERG
jgi:hypothetical protein